MTHYLDFDRGHFRCHYSMRHLGARHQHYGSDDDCAAEENVAVNAFVENEPSEKNCDHWIDVGVSRNLGGWDMLQQPDVGGVSDPGSANYEI